jgi:SAM-dependent methyltransferase
VTSADEEQAAFWEQLTPGWLAAEEHTELVSAPFGAAAMDALALQPGHRVLDLGCGSGGTTLELARRVTHRGEAVGIDIAPAMIDAAQGRATAEGAENATFAVADAQSSPLGHGAYDATFSRFGVMFFADAVAAFANIRTALRPHGLVAFACWQNLFANEWMFVPGSAVVSVTGALPPMPGPDEPGPFSLSEPGRVETVLAEAGFNDIVVTPHAHTIVLPEAQVASLATLSQRVGPVREALRTADAETAARIHDAVHAALEARVDQGELRLSSAAFIVTARA